MSYATVIAEEFLTELDELHSRIRNWAKALPPDEYRELATYLYWMKTDLSVTQIAEMIGYTPAAKVNEIVDKRYPFPVKCEVCKQEKYVHYNSRKRQKWGDYHRERLKFLTGEGWEERRASYIRGTYFEEHADDGFYEIDIAVRYSWGVPSDGVCDECRDHLATEFSEIQRLREQEIERCKKLPYQEYLKSDHWLRFRQHVLFSANNRCQLCNRNGGYGGVTLNVHHRTYENLGNESVRDVVVLCQNCHHTFHATGKLTK